MDTPLRVGIDARFPDGQSGGVQQWVIGLADALAQLDAGSEEYWFLVDPGHEQWLKPYLAGPCRLLPKRRRPLLRRAAGRARTWGRRLRARVADTWPNAVSMPRAMANPDARAPLPRSDGTVECAGLDVMHFTMQDGFLTSVPSIYQPWDLQHLHLPEFFTAEQHAWRERAYRAYCDQAALVVVASSWVKNDLAAQYGVAPDRIAVINVPPPTAAYSEPTPEETRAIARRLHLPERFVYYPAQTWPHKNHVRLLEALGLLRDEGVVVPLVCSGLTIDWFAKIEATADRLGLADNVHFLGFLEPAAVQVLYGTARALVFPSLYEGWGLPIVEAFQAGLPVVCSNVTSLPELVGDAALVFDPYDPGAIAASIRTVWTDDALAAKLARRGREVVRRFDWHRTALIVRAHYRKVAGHDLKPEDLALLEQVSSV